MTGAEEQSPEEQMPLLRLALLALGIPFAVIVCARWPLVTLALLAGLAWFTLRGRRDPFWGRLMFWAGVWGTIGEALCVYGSWTRDGRGLWIYAFPPLFGLALRLPIWIPLVWANLFALFVGIARRLVRPDATAKWLRYFAMLGIMAYAGALYRFVDVRILYIFTPVFVGFVLFWNTPRDLVLFLVAGVLGTFGEMMAMRFELWLYTKPLFETAWLLRLGVPGLPISLTMAWGLSGVFLNRVAGGK